eukprot:TRINITY_DN16011_c0_g2_i1.p2 TRINITY_DN16011_c0_g2~~TRINITY_DN16011_c0_g2_i1.p2  ORF type:complete len:111 (+),score=10.03 TRINITY_DN16011_c0_g2_i1:2-334(+)
MKLTDHLKENVSPLNVVCLQKDSGHWEEPASVDSSRSAKAWYEGKIRFSKPVHAEEDKVCKTPKPPIQRMPGRRLPGSNRYRYRIRWYPRLSPVIEVSTECCKVAHSLAP